MTATITIDTAGRCVLPKAIRDRLHLRAGSKVHAAVVADKIELTPVPDFEGKLVRRGKLLVLTGMRGVDAGEAVLATREDREEELARRMKKK